MPRNLIVSLETHLPQPIYTRMAAEAQVEEQQFFDLFDSYWFTHQILLKSENPPPQIQKNEELIMETSQNHDFSPVPTINIRSYSDQLSLNSKQQSFITDSPNSVLNLQFPKLQTIFSGKEVSEIDEKEIKIPVADSRKSPVKEKNRVLGRGRRSSGKSKSLTELEFEELKGFMDLGFVFSEKDRDSSLVSIIPGLQRLGKDEEEEVDACVAASRPYLSEAWSELEKRRKDAAMAEAVRMIRIPAPGNEAEMKHQLRFWAHSVASVVR